MTNRVFTVTDCTSTNRRPRLTLRMFTLFLVLLSAGFAGGCGDDPASSNNTTASTAGHIKGKVVNSRGEGIQGVKVYMNTTTFGGGIVTAATATTKADGTYDAAVPNGTYGVRAELTTTYNGRQYREYMSPDDGINGELIHESENGYVKNFTWKIAGEIPGWAYVPGEPHHYGGFINLGNRAAYNYANRDYQAPDGDPLPNGSTVEVTLTPDGPLLDGSQGEVVKRTFAINGQYWYSPEYDLLDIPVGRYTVSAVLIEANGARKNLLVSSLPGNDSTLRPTTAGATTVVEFWPVDFSTLTHGTWGTKLYLLQ